MDWYKNLYIGEKAKEHEQKIIGNIKKRKIVYNAYVITLPISKGNVLEIYPSFVLSQKHYRNIDFTVVGIAVGKDEALKIIENIIMDCYRATGEFDARQFVKM